LLPQSPDSAPADADFAAHAPQRFHGSLEPSIGRVTPPANVTADTWVAYLAQTCSSLGTQCTGFSTAGILKGLRGSFGDDQRSWQVLSSWEVAADPNIQCAGFYVKLGSERGGCPQVCAFIGSVCVEVLLHM
jgi:hypothetical protein